MFSFVWPLAGRQFMICLTSCIVMYNAVYSNSWIEKSIIGHIIPLRATFFTKLLTVELSYFLLLRKISISSEYEFIIVKCSCIEVSLKTLSYRIIWLMNTVDHSDWTIKQTFEKWR